MPKLPEQTAIEYLFTRKYPNYILRKGKVEERPFGTLMQIESNGIEKDAISPLLEMSEKYIKLEQAKSFFLELQSKTPDEIKHLVSNEKEKSNKEEKARIEMEEKTRFFHQPYANADFDHWSKITTWTIEQFVALSLGKNPHIVNWEKVYPHSYESPFAQKYQQVKELVHNAFSSWKKLHDPDYPANFVRWAKSVELDFPEELAELVEKRSGFNRDLQKAYDDMKDAYKTMHENVKKQNGIIDDWESVVKGKDKLITILEEKIKGLEDSGENHKVKSNKQEPEKPLNKKVEDTLLKLFIGMAVYSYGYDSVFNNITKASRISTDILTDSGISIDEDTVRKYLKQARKLLPELETEQN